MAAPKAAKTPPESMSPDDSMAPAVVVAIPTPKPPEVPPAAEAPMKTFPPTDKSWAGVVEEMPSLLLAVFQKRLELVKKGPVPFP